MVRLRVIGPEADDVAVSSPPKRSATTRSADVNNELRSWGKDALIALVLQMAHDAPDARQRLLLAVESRSSSGAAAVAALRKRLRTALTPRGFVEYRAAVGWARGARQCLEALTTVLTPANAEPLRVLMEDASHWLDRATSHMDDSDGHHGTIRLLIEDLHHQACVLGRPEPRALARRLFELQTTTEYDGFDDAIGRYAAVLGPAGIEEFRRVAQEAWATTPATRARRGVRVDSDTFRITRVMKQVAEETRDLALLLDIQKNDLSYPLHYLEVAETYERLGDVGAAVEWIIHGIDAFPDFRDQRLPAHLIDLYRRDGRFDEAMNVAWEAFVADPGAPTYALLRDVAQVSDRWPATRERAISHVEGVLGSGTARSSAGAVCGGTLVEMLIADGDHDRAWRAANTRDCTPHTLFRLAMATKLSHPDLALPVFTKELTGTLRHANDASYRQVLGLLREIEPVMPLCTPPADFAGLVADVRQRYARRSNLIKQLDRAGLR